MTDPRVSQIEEEFKRIVQADRQYASVAELNAEDWPACPECGTTISVTPVKVGAAGVAAYIAGRWFLQCGCIPGVA